MPHAKHASEQRPMTEVKTTAMPAEAKKTPKAMKKAGARSKMAVNSFTSSQTANK
jgi:hypothetical protein